MPLSHMLFVSVCKVGYISLGLLAPCVDGHLGVAACIA